MTTRWADGWIRGWALLLAAALALVAAVVVAPGARAADEPRAALSVAKSVVPSTARPGDRVTWTVKVTCESIVTMCADVVMTDLVPEPFELQPDGVSVQGQRTGSADVAVDGRQVRVTFRETDSGRPGLVGLAAGQSLSVLLTTVLPVGTPLAWDGRTVTNTADVTGSNADPAGDDAAVDIVVPVTPGVAVTKSWTPADQVAGDESDIALVLGVANTSPVAATSLTLTDPAAGTPAAFGPGTPVALRGFGDWTAPAGATSLTVDLLTASGVTTLGPFAPGEPITTGGTDLAEVSGVTLRFAGDGPDGGTIVAAGAAGSVTLVTGQDGTAARDAVTRVPNTVAGAVVTAHGSASRTASADLQLNPVTVEVTAGKTIQGVAQARVVAGTDAVVRLTATNSSNTALGTLTVREPSGATDPFGALADGRLQVLGFGADGSGTSPASDWPQGATSAEVTLTGTGPGLPVTVPVAAPTGGTITWPAVPDGAVLTGLSVAYTGTIVPGASAAIPVAVRTGADWDTVRGFPNEVAVGGTATDGTVAPERTATAALTVVPRRVVTTTSKSLTQTANGEQVTGAVGQEVVARLTGRISADTTVPVGRLVIEDVADGGAGSTLWDAAALDRIGSVQVPSGSRAEVLVRSGGVWTTVAGPTTDATTLLDLAVPAGLTDVDGVRVVYTPVAADGSLRIDGSFTPVVTLVLALTEAQTPGTRLTNTASTTGTGTDPGLSGTSGADTGTTVGPGETPLDVRQVDASKGWRDAAALVPVDNAEPDATDRPTNRLTMSVQNVSGIPVGTLRLVDPDPSVAANAFDHVDLTHLAVTLPTGATSVQAVLRDADGAVLHTLTSAAAVAALSAAELADVVSVEVRAEGTLPDGARLTVVADTRLRAATRAAGTPIVGTQDGAASTTLRNTLLGDLGAGTPSDAAQADTLLYPEALQPLDGALAKSVTPGTGTRYSAEDRTVRLALSARRTSDAAVSRPAQYVLEDTTEAFWDRFDLTGLQSLSGITAEDGTGWTAAVQYRVDGAWSAAVTSELQPGTAGSMPTLPTGAAALDGVDGTAVTGVRVTFTAPADKWFANRAVGGFEGPTALFSLSPRSTLRSTGAEVPADTVQNVLTGTVQAEHSPSPIVLDPVEAPYTVVDGTPDAAVTKSPVTTTTGPGAVVPFTLTATNSGTTPLVDPVLTDLLPSDAEGPLLVQDDDAYGEVVVSGALADADIEATVTVDGDRVQVTFPPGTRLMPGERVSVLLPLAVRTGTAAGLTLTNRFELTAAGGLSREATATVDVVAMATYLRVKDVAEDLAPGAEPTGVVSTSGGVCTSADGFYRNPCLVRTAPGGTETWRMRVTNTGNLPTASLTLVDVLPFAGDTGTSRSQSGSARGSVWATEYLGDLRIEGVPDGGTTTVSYLLDGQTCRYTGDPRSADPFGTGCATGVWTPADEVDDLSLVRGVRVDVDVTGTPLQPGDTLTATFRTRSASAYDLAAADADAPAWNTMVVSTASIGTAGLEHETLEPNRAGVAVDRSYAVGDRVWSDRDRDGRQGDGEPGIAGVTVLVYPEGSDEPVASAVTDADGRYVVDLLPAGRYQLRFVLDDAAAARYTFTRPGIGGAASDSDADPASGWTAVVVLGAGEPRVRPTTSADGLAADYLDPTVDAGLVERPVRVGDLVWVDTDGDGIQGPGEPGIPGVVLTLTHPDGTAVTDVLGRPVGPVTTDASGGYLFTDLAPGRYVVTIDRIASADALRGYDPTAAGAGSDRGADSSTWTAGSVALAGGEEDLTLDFGFVPIRVTPVTPVDPGTPGEDGAVRLAIDKTAVDRAAGRITWKLTVLSAGTADATRGFTVTDALPADLTYVSATGDGFACSLEDRTVVCRFAGTLPAGATAVVTLVTAVTPGATVRNTATVDPSGRGYASDVLPASDGAASVAVAGELARTGLEAGWLLLVALIALLGGVLLVVERRLRRE